MTRTASHSTGSSWDETPYGSRDEIKSKPLISVCGSNTRPSAMYNPRARNNHLFVFMNGDNTALISEKGHCKPYCHESLSEPKRGYRLNCNNDDARTSGSSLPEPGDFAIRTLPQPVFVVEYGEANPRLKAAAKL